MYCEKCGALLKEGLVFCTQCGAKIEPAGAAPPQNPAAAGSQSQYNQPVNQNADFDNVYGQYNQNQYSYSSLQPQNQYGASPQQPANQYSDFSYQPQNQNTGFDNVYGQYNQNYSYNPQPAFMAQPGGYGFNPSVKTNVKQAASSALFLFAVILFSVDIIYGAFFENSIYSAVYQIFSAAGMSITDLGFNISAFATATRIASAILAIPDLLIVLGLWLVFGSAKSKAPKLKTGGLTLIKVIMIIRFVLFCVEILTLEIIIIICAIVIGASGSYFNLGYVSSFGVAAFILIFFIIAGAAVVDILYYVKIIKMLNSATLAADVGGKVFASVYVVVICFFTVLSFIYSLVLKIISLITYFRYGIATVRTIFSYSFGIISVLCGAIAVILFAIIIIKLKKEDYVRR